MVHTQPYICLAHLPVTGWEGGVCGQEGALIWKVLIQVGVIYPLFYHDLMMREAQRVASVLFKVPSISFCLLFPLACAEYKPPSCEQADLSRVASLLLGSWDLLELQLTSTLQR